MILFSFLGDPRRPYPTDYEMRSGWLAKMSDIPANTPAIQAQGSYGEPMASNRNPLPGGTFMIPTSYLKVIYFVSGSNEFLIIRPPIVLVESGLLSEQVSLLRPICIENCILVLKQLVLIVKVVLISSGLYSIL